MNALVVYPGQKPRIIDITGELQELQQIVGGTIDVIDPYEDEIIFILNDEGKMLGLPPNRRINDWITIHGTFLICGSDKEGNTIGLTDEQTKRYTEIMMFADVTR